MVKSISINNQNIQVKQYNGQMVVTFKDIDLVHGRANGTARRNFNANKQHLIEGTDYFIIELTTNEIRTQFGAGKNAGRTITVVTESGYLMLVKSFTDNLAWEVQRQLVNSYFRCKEETAQNSTPYEYFDKTYNGIPVLTSLDIAYITGIGRTSVNFYLNGHAEQNEDYYTLEKGELAKFKRENPKIKKCAGRLNVITKKGFVKICQVYDIKVEQPKCFEEQAEQLMLDLNAEPSPNAEEKIFANIKKVRNKNIAVNELLDAVERLLESKNNPETIISGRVVYDYYISAFKKVLNYYQINID